MRYCAPCLPHTPLQKVRWFEGNELFDYCSVGVDEYSEQTFSRRETMPGLILTNSVHKDASAGAARGYPPQLVQGLALSNQRWVSSSVQPGTAKRAGAVTPWLGRAMTCWGVRKCTVGGLERCAAAASAEADRVTNRPKARTERIALAPYLTSTTLADFWIDRRNWIPESGFQ